MTCQAKTEPLETFTLDTIDVVFNAFTLLHGMGYRGSLNATGESDARIDMSMADGVPIAVSVGDVILYRASGPTVVKCLTMEEFTAGYDIL